MMIRKKWCAIKIIVSRKFLLFLFHIVAAYGYYLYSKLNVSSTNKTKKTKQKKSFVHSGKNFIVFLKNVDADWTWAPNHSVS